MRMPRYDVTNNGMGPYAIFYCDKCDKEYRSQPNITQTVKQDVTRGAFGGLLRNVPLVGNSMANNLDNDRYRTNMTPQELDQAWGQVQQYLRECPTCHQVVCVPDFDETTGFCRECTPRREEFAQAQTEQAIGFMKGVAGAFGITDAMKRATDQAQARQAAPMVSLTTCARCGAQAPVGTRFCPGCGAPMAQPAPAAAAAVTCPNCQAQVPAGMRFCGSCGSPVQPAAPQEVACPNCGTPTTAIFCGNCGSKVR